jgi:hypothetical protein
MGLVQCRGLIGTVDGSILLHKLRRRIVNQGICGKWEEEGRTVHISMRISAVDELPLRSELVEIGGLFWPASVLKSEILSPSLAAPAMRRAQARPKTTMPGEMIPSQSLRISCVRRCIMIYPNVDSEFIQTS